jgi:RNA polymerase primary sigma factor
MKPLLITEKITSRETDSFNKYLRDIDAIPMLSVDEEYETALEAAKGDKEAIDKLVRSNLRFVVSVAKQYDNPEVKLEDLVNEGNMGLMRAAERFDPSRGFKFISYAVWWIRNRILEYLTKHSRLIKLPSNRVVHLNKMYEIVSNLEQEIERKASHNEIIEALEEAEFTEGDIIFFLEMADNRTLSLDKPIRGSSCNTN